MHILFIWSQRKFSHQRCKDFSENDILSIFREKFPGCTTTPLVILLPRSRSKGQLPRTKIPNMLLIPFRNFLSCLIPMNYIWVILYTFSIIYIYLNYAIQTSLLTINPFKISIILINYYPNFERSFYSFRQFWNEDRDLNWFSGNFGKLASLRLNY